MTVVLLSVAILAAMFIGDLVLYVRRGWSLLMPEMAKRWKLRGLLIAYLVIIVVYAGFLALILMVNS